MAPRPVDKGISFSRGAGAKKAAPAAPKKPEVEKPLPDELAALRARNEELERALAVAESTKKAGDAPIVRRVAKSFTHI